MPSRSTLGRPRVLHSPILTPVLASLLIPRPSATTTSTSGHTAPAVASSYVAHSGVRARGVSRVVPVATGGHDLPQVVDGRAQLNERERLPMNRGTPAPPRVHGNRQLVNQPINNNQELNNQSHQYQAISQSLKSTKSSNPSSQPQPRSLFFDGNSPVRRKGLAGDAQHVSKHASRRSLHAAGVPVLLVYPHAKQPERAIRFQEERRNFQHFQGVPVRRKIADGGGECEKRRRGGAVHIQTRKPALL